MSTPWWQSRDPDLPRDRATKALGRRDWGWFTSYPGSNLSPADLETAQTPWASHPVTAKDRYDRTLGIPPREISMWPDHQPYVQPGLGSARGRDARAPASRAAAQAWRRDQVEEILDELSAVEPPPGPPEVAADELGHLLRDLAPRVYGRSPAQQFNEISALARARNVPTTTLLGLARQTGTLIAQTTHLPAPDAAGESSLNRLLGADLDLAGELLLARTTLANAAAYSDPDLPRLWILANALHHALPASVITTQVARSHGPAAQIMPLHDDLVAWPGVGRLVEQLRVTVAAAAEGRRWLHALGTGSPTAEDRILALGILHLTHPRTAHELALAGPVSRSASALRQVANTLPTVDIVSDLSDSALKAVCDRNGWLVGTADERTHRELVERHVGTAVTDDVRAQLAAGDTTALTAALTARAPADHDLDQAAWRHDPPFADMGRSRQLLYLGSREAIHRFTGIMIEPRSSRAAALLARFPDRASQRGLHINPAELTESRQVWHSSNIETNQPELDLGI